MKNPLFFASQPVLSIAIALIFGIAVGTAQSIQTNGDVNQPYTGSGSTWVIDGSAANGADGLRIGDVIGANGGVGSLLVSGGATVLNNDSFGAGNIAGSAVLGYNEGTSGTATITGAGSVWTNQFSLSVGASGQGTLEILDGGVVSSYSGGIGLNPDAAGFPSPTGLVTVSGTGSQWNNISIPGDPFSGELYVGFFNEGTLNIAAGGVVNNTNGYIGNATAGSSGGDGTVNVSGASQWNNSGNLDIGGDSFGLGTSGVLNISDTATVTVDGTMKLYEPGTVNLSGGKLDVGTLDLASTGFSMTGGRLVAQTILGDFNHAAGTLAPGNSPGLIDIEGDYNMMVDAVLEFELAGLDRETEFDAIDVSGIATLDGIVDINLIDGFEALEGDTFLLVYAGTGSGSLFGDPTFDFSDASLTSGLAWNTSGFLSNGTISVTAIPEPGSAAVIVGLCLLFALRRVTKRG